MCTSEAHSTAGVISYLLCRLSEGGATDVHAYQGILLYVYVQ